MQTGYYILGGVSVAAGSDVLTATSIQVPGAASEAVNFVSLVGLAGQEGTPAGFLLQGPAGQIAVAMHALTATTLKLALPWAGANVVAGTVLIVPGLNALPIGAHALKILQMITQGSLATASRLAEYLADPAAQVAARFNIHAQEDLGFTPVEQGGGAGMLTNKVHLGWSRADLIAEVDAVPLGRIWSDYHAARSLGAAGYQRLPGGLLVQWGRVLELDPGPGGAYVTFPIAFAGGPWSVVVSAQSAFGAHAFVAYSDWVATTAAGFPVYARYITSGSVESTVNANINWMALGPAS